MRIRRLRSDKELRVKMWMISTPRPYRMVWISELHEVDVASKILKKRRVDVADI